MFLFIQPGVLRRPLGLQLREEIDGVEHLTVGVVELEHAHVDQPHREHLGHAVAAGHAPTAVDADVLLDVGHLDGVRPELEEVPGPGSGRRRRACANAWSATSCCGPAGSGTRTSVTSDFLSIGAALYRAGRRDGRRLSSPTHHPVPLATGFIVRRHARR